MSKRKSIIALVVVAVAVVGWYLFRPELLFFDATVNEDFPLSHGDNSSNQILYVGKFSGVAHEARGQATVYQLPEGKRVLRFTDFETSNGPAVHVYLTAAEEAHDDDSVTNAGFVSLGAIKGNKGDQNYDLPGDLDLGKYRSVVVWCKRFGVNFATAPLRMSGPVTLFEGRFHGVAHEASGAATVYRFPDGRRVLRFTDFETSNGPDVRVLLAEAANADDNESVTRDGYISLGSIKGNKGDQNYELPGDLDLDKYHSVVVWCNRFGVNFATASLAPAMSAR